MSHYTKLNIQAQQKFEFELFAALKEHFGDAGVESHDKAASLKSWTGADSGLQANLIVRKSAQSKKAGHEVLSNDLGYLRNSTGGYDVHADEAGFPVKDQHLVAQYYARNVTTKQMRQQGYNVRESELPNGEIRLHCSKY
jgi:hypothetical protein